MPTKLFLFYLLTFSSLSYRVLAQKESGDRENQPYPYPNESEPEEPPGVPPLEHLNVITSSEAQSSVTSEAPPEEATSKPSATSSEVPSNATSEEPPEETTAKPSATSSEVPSNATSEEPPEETTAKPSATSSEPPSNVTLEERSEKTTIGPSNSTSEPSEETTVSSSEIATAETSSVFTENITTYQPPSTEGLLSPTVPAWPKPHCENPRLSDPMRQYFLDMHNYLRGSLARGETEKSEGWGIAPPAAVMNRMKYDCDAESYAQQHASTCITNPLPPHAREGYEENLFIFRDVTTTHGRVAQVAMTSWWSELARHGMRSNMLFFETEFNRGNRHVLNWSKMAWWDNSQLGCAIQNCGIFYFVVCMYTGGGNRVNQHVYPIGAVCSQCPPGRCDGQALCRW